MADANPVRKSPPQKNELKPQYLPAENLYIVRYTGQGATPAALEGKYTSEREATKQINIYLKKKKR